MTLERAISDNKNIYKIKKAGNNMKEEVTQTSYTLGILSIVLGFFQPLAAIVLGIVGLIQSKKSTSELGKKAKKLNTIGIIIGIVVLILYLIAMIFLKDSFVGNLTPQ